MGYSHAWYTALAIPPASWQRFLTLSASVLSALPATVPFGAQAQPTPLVLRGRDGTGAPEQSIATLAFNGDRAAGHAGETFRISRDVSLDRLVGGQAFGFCKTGQLPYDLAVVAVLCALKTAVPTTYLSSAGSPTHLAAGQALFAAATGQPAPAFDEVGEDGDYD